MLFVGTIGMPITMDTEANHLMSMHLSQVHFHLEQKVKLFYPLGWVAKPITEP